VKKHAYKIRLALALAVFITAVLGIYGIYSFKVLDVQFAALFQRALAASSVSALVLLFGAVLITIIFGRFYCSLLCPFGIMQELAALVLRRKKKNRKTANYPVKHFICALSFGALFAGSAVIIRYFDPYSIFGSALSLSAFGIITAIAVLVLVFFKNRFFCTNICPVGAFLGCCAKTAVNTMNIDADKCIGCRNCERNCPAGCIDIENKKIDNEMCVKCLKCLSVCPKDAVYYGYKKPEFSPSKRKALIGTSAAVLLAAGYAAGIKFTKELGKKVKDIILPPGAINAGRMFNKCLNCNLCIKNCPNGILVKADDKFGAVHIDYSKGFCGYDCHKCSEVCPSGAIIRLPLNEKQNIRTAMAEIKNEGCIKCGKCASVCPKDAVSQEHMQLPKLDASKCIGCGKCAHECPVKTIVMHGIKEQTVI